ncbi:hypothetical protein FGG08_007094 [Glutinoglossum americanum]|uniref:Uncharacterized protein n=1 Tax=Glutinoglossum americanum TaxID=1670608 RepID=A0A9P8KWT3_9PEZI|nr:hypothetical protein FGG08_007094 [Glutinoglossum americanum]
MSTARSLWPLLEHSRGIRPSEHARLELMKWTGTLPTHDGRRRSRRDYPQPSSPEITQRKDGYSDTSLRLERLLTGKDDVRTYTNTLASMLENPEVLPSPDLWKEGDLDARIDFFGHVVEYFSQRPEHTVREFSRDNRAMLIAKSFGLADAANFSDFKRLVLTSLSLWTMLAKLFHYETVDRMLEEKFPSLTDGEREDQRKIGNFSLLDLVAHGELLSRDTKQGNNGRPGNKDQEARCCNCGNFVLPKYLRSSHGLDSITTERVHRTQVPVRELNAEILAAVGKLQIDWTKDVGEHLELKDPEGDNPRLSVFQMPSKFDLEPNRGTPEWLLMNGSNPPVPLQYTLDVLHSYPLLFGYDNSTRKFFKQEARRWKLEDTRLPVKCLSGKFRVWRKEDFPYLWPKVVKLDDYLASIQPEGLMEVLRDRRDQNRKWTLQ